MPSFAPPVAPAQPVADPEGGGINERFISAQMVGSRAAGERTMGSTWWQIGRERPVPPVLATHRDSRVSPRRVLGVDRTGATPDLPFPLVLAPLPPVPVGDGRRADGLGLAVCR